MWRNTWTSLYNIYNCASSNTDTWSSTFMSYLMLHILSYQRWYSQSTCSVSKESAHTSLYYSENTEDANRRQYEHYLQFDTQTVHKYITLQLEENQMSGVFWKLAIVCHVFITHYGLRDTYPKGTWTMSKVQKTSVDLPTILELFPWSWSVIAS